MPYAVFLDESHQHTRHPILSVGGFVCDLAEVPKLEAAWVEAKAALGLKPDEQARYAKSWEDPADRLRLIEQVPRLGVGIAAVAALLEDFRPTPMRHRKPTAKDMYVQRQAFAYVLQRLGDPHYLPRDATGPHVVYAHRHDDFRSYDAEYAKGWAEGWRFSSGRSIRPLREAGFAAACAQMSGGPAMEIADLIGAAVARWAAAMVAHERGQKAPDLPELETAMRALLPLFPTHGSIPPRWRGYSLIAFRENRTGKEVIYDRIDGWVRALLSDDGAV